MRGRLIVVEGTDCSGKQTQTELLISKLKLAGILVELKSFPMYDTPTGKIVGGPYLGKEHISKSWFQEGATNVDAKIASLYYAADRLYNISEINTLLEKGINVILDRYVYSNMAHQGSKIDNKKERNDFYKWLEKLEFDFLKLPKPGINIFLHMPFQCSLKLSENREEALDEHESSKKHLINAEKAYLEIASLYNFEIIKCGEKTKPRRIESINNELTKKIKSFLSK